MWSGTPELLATDPHFPVNLWDRCLDPDAVTVGTRQRTLYCDPTENGRNRGTLVWHLQPQTALPSGQRHPEISGYQ